MLCLLKNFNMRKSILFIFLIASALVKAQTFEGTDLRIEMDMEESFDDYFNETWPLALVHLRDLCEAEANKSEQS